MAEIKPIEGPPAPAPLAARTEPHPAEPREKKSHVWIWVVAAVAIVGIAVLVYFRNKKPPPKPPPPITISTTNAQSGDIDETVSALGSVLPINQVGISPNVSGQLVKVNYTEGQMVDTNDLLVEIDPHPYQALLIEGQGQLGRDSALLAEAKIDFDRYQAAYQKKAIPKQTLDDQEQLVHQDEGTVKYDQGVVSNAQVQLGYCSIHAPIAGRVGLRLVDQGNIVLSSSTNALVMITQLQPITVVFAVAEDVLPSIQQQMQQSNTMPVEAWDRDWGKKIAQGTFLTMDNVIDPSTGTVRIKGIFTNNDFALFPNQFVNAKLIIDTLHDVTLIPTAAIQRNPQGAFVYEVKPDQTVTMRQITLGISENDVTAVTGLDPGTSIATDNFNKLGEGTKVTVRNDTTGGASPDKTKKHGKKKPDTSSQGQNDAS